MAINIMITDCQEECQCACLRACAVRTSGGHGKPYRWSHAHGASVGQLNDLSDKPINVTICHNISFDVILRINSMKTDDSSRYKYEINVKLTAFLYIS